MAKISIFFSPYKPQAISKQNANSAGRADPYAPKKPPPINKKQDIWIECHICKLKVKHIKKHLKKIHNE